MIGAHPDDEDTGLIAWLSRGRHVRTGYLSLTRGDGGQNLIGNELGEALGVIRTEELIAARHIDGGEQYFTRAFDFGFSKDTLDTYKHWPKDSILGDVVRVIRYMRPHVIVAVWSGTPRDGHGHHQVAGLLAREAFDAAGDMIRFPLSRYGPSWLPLKFYRVARGNQQAGAVAIEISEYSPLIGRTFAEIAAESRSQHKSQGFGTAQPRGRVMDYLRREASRVNESAGSAHETSIFDGIDTSWARFGPFVTDSARAALDSLPQALADAMASYAPMAPVSMLPSVARVQRLARRFGESANLDLVESLDALRERTERALQLVTGSEIEALVPRAVIAAGREVPVVVTDQSRWLERYLPPDSLPRGVLGPVSTMRRLPAGAARVDTGVMHWSSITQPFWLERPRVGSMFWSLPIVRDEARRPWFPKLGQQMFFDAADFFIEAPLAHRTVDPVKGETRHFVAVVPAISVNTDAARTAEVILELPAGLSANGTNRVAVLGGYGATAVVTFHVRGTLAAGEHKIAVVVESGGETFTSGYTLIDYDHIEPQRVYRPAEITISAVDVRVPPALRVAYISGVGDNVAPMLQQLGIPVTVVPATDVAHTNLTRFTTVVVGPRAYEAHAELVASNAQILEFARKGGTVVVQYGQYEMTQPGIMPYPITINRPADRVTLEDAPVTVLDSSARELRWPHRITSADFQGWVQERSLYMPRSFDPNYRPLLAMSDSNEPPNRGAILTARLDRGRYIYTSMAFFRQLPAGVPGAARLFVNLLSAGLPATRTP